MSRAQLVATAVAAIIAAVIVTRIMQAPLPQAGGKNPNLHKRLQTKLSPDVDPSTIGDGYPQHLAHPLELGLSILTAPHPLYGHASSMSPNCSKVQDHGWGAWAFDPPSEVDI